MVKFLSPKSNAPVFKGSLFEIDNWQVSEVVLNKIVPIAGTHPFPLNELLLMVGAVARFQPRIIFEWGTHVGKSARIFYEAAQALGVKTEIHSIDLPDDVEHGEHPHGSRGEMVRGIKSVKLHQGDGLDTSLGILAKQKGSMKTGQGTLFFVDGDHSYESVKRELSGIAQAAPQAAILLHDSFYQDPKSGYNVGPHRAISEHLASSKSKYIRLDTATGLPGMTLLYPK